MREKQLRLVITFYTTADAMATEQLCSTNGIPGKLFSAPRILSADCGIAWQSPLTERNTLVSLLAERSIEVHSIHELMV